MSNDVSFWSGSLLGICRVYYICDEPYLHARNPQKKGKILWKDSLSTRGGSRVWSCCDYHAVTRTLSSRVSANGVPRIDSRSGSVYDIPNKRSCPFTIRLYNVLLYLDYQCDTGSGCGSAAPFLAYLIFYHFCPSSEGLFFTSAVFDTIHLNY
jgi:hypothetical protein